MKISFILISLLFLSLIGGGLYLYYFYEKPIMDNQIEYESLNIIAYNEKGKEVITEYVIVTNIASSNSIYKEGTTLRNGFILEKLPRNLTFYVYNRNKDLYGQNYYAEIQKIDTFVSGPYKASFHLKSPGELAFERTGEFPDDEIINLTISTEGFYNNLKFCVKWSINVISVNIKDGAFSTDKREGFDRCYDTGKSLENNSTNIQFSYTYFGIIDSKDFIEFTFFDDDKVDNNRNKTRKIYKVTK
jgi:hypothetical protein